VKHFIVACAFPALACGPVHAQANVTVYGVVDIGIEDHNSATGAALSAPHHHNDTHRRQQ
jgi:predicted porin